MFNELGYCILRGIVEPQTCKLISKELDLLKKATDTELNLDPKQHYGDELVAECFAWYAAFCTESLLLVLQDRIEQEVNLKLLPTYSYARIYYNQASMQPHTDRPSCEYSATICLEADTVAWPIHITGFDGVSKAVQLDPGDVLIYQGTKLTHWREIYHGHRQVQCFLHYVDANGQYQDYQYDRRPGLGFPVTSKI